MTPPLPRAALLLLHRANLETMRDTLARLRRYGWGARELEEATDDTEAALKGEMADA